MVFKSHDKDPFTLLRQSKMNSIIYTIIRMVTQFAQYFHYLRYGFPAIMSDKKLDVFKNKCLWFLFLKDSGYFKKERPSRVFKTFHMPDDAERLARETCKQYIVVRNMMGIDFGYITFWLFPKISCIRFSAFSVN